MVDCTSFDSLLVSWLYDELEPAEATRFTRHIEGCDACWRTAKAMIRIRVLMRELPEPPPPPASVRILREAAKQTERARRPGPWAWLVSSLELFRGHPAAAAVATLVLVAGVAGALLARGQLEDAAPAPWLAGAPLEAEATPAPGDAVAGAVPAAPEPEMDRLSKLAAAGPDRTDEARERASGTRRNASPGRTAAEPESSKRREGARQRPAPERPRAPAAQVMDLALAGESDEGKERHVGHEQAVARAGDGSGSGAGSSAGLAAVAPREPGGAAEAAAVPPITATARSEAKPDDDSEHAQPRQSAPRRDQRPPSEAMHEALRTALREQECARAVRIAEGIRARDPGYYRARIAGGKELAACRKAAAPDSRAGQGGASKSE